eukprot:scaffold322087_cov32-Tisochrysis_lutea.AAC.3
MDRLRFPSSPARAQRARLPQLGLYTARASPRSRATARLSRRGGLSLRTPFLPHSTAPSSAWACACPTPSLTPICLSGFLAPRSGPTRGSRSRAACAGCSRQLHADRTRACAEPDASVGETRDAHSFVCGDHHCPHPRRRPRK